jgi:tRNA dimethylallyltransferase
LKGYFDMSSMPELLAIVGPTASGKSDLALRIAQEFNGEIIAADSRTIYKGMDIGTAKPSKVEQKLIPHWGLDLINPGESYSAFQFKKYAEAKISDIKKRGKLPILVGGTGLYVDSVLFDFGFVETKDSEQRNKLEELSVDQLQKLIKDRKYLMPENKNNRRYLIRTIERQGKTGSNRSIKDNTAVIGLNPLAESLKERIYARSKRYFEQGLLKETKELIKKYGKENVQKTHGIAYIASLKFLENEIDGEEALELIQKQEWQYARRQRTWFRRNKFIRWFDSPTQAYKEIVRILNN